MMKNKIKSGIITSAMIASMLIPNTTAFASTTFTDVKQSDWYYSTVTKLADTGIVNGTGDGSFNPTGEVGIDAFVKMLVMARGMEINSELANVFWSKPYLQSIYDNGFRDLIDAGITYYTPQDTKYYDSFSKPITRERMAALVARALELDGKFTDTIQFDTTAYNDFTSIDNKYNLAVRSVIINGIMGGKDGGIFDPQATVTRAEAATVIARYLYPEERLKYTYSAKQESHNVGDVYTEYNIWPVPVEVKFYETNQAIPTISEVSRLYVEELGKYIYAGMPVSELEEIMGGKATEDAKLSDVFYYYTDDGKIKISYTNKVGYVTGFSINKPYTAAFNGHSIGEEPMLMDEYIPRTEYEEFFTNGGAIDVYPHIEGIYEMNGIKMKYSYYTDGVTQAALDRWGISEGNESNHLPTILSFIAIHGSTEINRTLSIE